MEDPYLEAADDIEHLAEKDVEDFVGEYRLVKTHKVKLNLVVSR